MKILVTRKKFRIGTSPLPPPQFPKFAAFHIIPFENYNLPLGEMERKREYFAVPSYTPHILQYLTCFNLKYERENIFKCEKQVSKYS